MSCSCNSNPCHCNPTNTAACETLASQIANFTTQFFGIVTKTEINGAVEWTLPCNLDIGLENNPRLDDEGVACYLLRLIQNGIVGLTGPQGESGDGGADGFNSYTVTLAGFTQPSSGSPNVTVQTSYNPAILVGLEVFISTSGWYVVNEVTTEGTLFLSLTQGLSGAPGTITAGKLVVPTGPAGRSIQGNPGVQGVPGETGSPGESHTETNDHFFTTVGVDYALPNTYTKVDFNNAIPEVLLPVAGTYLITASVSLIGEATVMPTDSAELKLRDITNSFDLDGSVKTMNDVPVDALRQVIISVLYTTDSANHTVSLYGKCTTASAMSVGYAQTNIVIVRIA